MSDRGILINRKASLGSEIVRLKEQIPEVAKQARKTPAKTMRAEIAKVEAAKVTLPLLRGRLEILETELEDVTKELEEMPRTSEAIPERVTKEDWKVICQMLIDSQFSRIQLEEIRERFGLDRPTSATPTICGGPHVWAISGDGMWQCMNCTAHRQPPAPVPASPTKETP